MEFTLRLVNQREHVQREADQPGDSGGRAQHDYGKDVDADLQHDAAGRRALLRGKR